jgi:hypothetical protein
MFSVESERRTLESRLFRDTIHVFVLRVVLGVFLFQELMPSSPAT